jgi:hypothetical protein
MESNKQWQGKDCDRYTGIWYYNFGKKKYLFRYFTFPYSKITIEMHFIRNTRGTTLQIVCIFIVLHLFWDIFFSGIELSQPLMPNSLTWPSSNSYSSWGFFNVSVHVLAATQDLGSCQREQQYCVLWTNPSSPWGEVCTITITRVTIYRVSGWIQ